MSVVSAGSYIPPALDAGSSVVGSVALSAADSKLVQAGLKRENAEIRAQRERLVTIFSTTVASMAILTAIIAMWWEASAIAFVAFAFPLVTAPIAISQRQRLHKMSTFKQEVNEIRTLVNDLAMENTRLSLHNVELEKRVQQLKAVENDFENLAQTSGKDVEQMRQLAHEYSLIQKEMASVNQTSKMQKFLQAILRSDQNTNFELDSPQEVDLLVARLRAIGGVDFNEQVLRDSISSSQSKSLSTIYKVASDVVDDNSGIEMT